MLICHQVIEIYYRIYKKKTLNYSQIFLHLSMGGTISSVSYQIF